MLDKVFVVILVLNATDLFRFVAPLYGGTLAHVSLGLLCAQVFYLVARRRYVYGLFRQPAMKGWIIVLLIWPVISVMYAPAVHLREIGLQLHYVSLFLGAVVYCMSRGLRAMRFVLAVSLAVSLFGLVLSMAAPGLFEPAAAIAHSPHYYGGRAFGFFIQPNQAALSVTILFLGWYSLWLAETSRAAEAFPAVLLLAVITTGSRIGIVLATLLCGLIAAHAGRSVIANWAARARVLRKVAITALCAMVALATAYSFGVPAALPQPLAERIALLSRGRLTDGELTEDSSLSARLRAQKVYRSLIGEKPFLGHGLGAETYYREQGPIRLTSHSSVHNLAMQYGVFHPLAFGLLLLHMLMTRHRAHVEHALRTNAIMQFVIITGATLVVSCGLDDSRAFYIVFGTIAAVVFFPQLVSSITRRPPARPNARPCHGGPRSSRWAGTASSATRFGKPAAEV